MKKHPTKIGSIWSGEQYVHGPRKEDPKDFSKFRIGKPNKDGIRLVFGLSKKTNKWEVQSKLTPRKATASALRKKTYKRK